MATRPARHRDLPKVPSPVPVCRFAETKPAKPQIARSAARTACARMRGKLGWRTRNANSNKRACRSLATCPSGRRHVRTGAATFTSPVWRLSPKDEPVARPVSATRAPTREGPHRRLVYVEAERNWLYLGAGQEREDGPLHARSAVERNRRLQDLAIELL